MFYGILQQRQLDLAIKGYLYRQIWCGFKETKHLYNKLTILGHRLQGGGGGGSPTYCLAPYKSLKMLLDAFYNCMSSDSCDQDNNIYILTCSCHHLELLHKFAYMCARWCVFKRNYVYSRNCGEIEKVNVLYNEGNWDYAWINNYMLSFLWDVITHPRSNFHLKLCLNW